MITIGGMAIEEMSAFPEGKNPFEHDRFHMGTNLGDNVLIMHPNHPDKEAEYLIVVNKRTGKRIRIYFPEIVLKTGGQAVGQAGIMDRVYSDLKPGSEGPELTDSAMTDIMREESEREREAQELEQD